MEQEIRSPAVFTREGRFFDAQGRQVILHGINLVNKDTASGYIGPEGPAEFADFRRWGFNCLRLGVIWDGLEPQPGVFDERYLRALDRQIAWASANDLLVFLDMHQDLYSVLFSDGAPAWATLTDGLPHETPGGVWSDAYFTSPAVQTALDHFWRNDPAPDGRGLQEHYALAWQTLARRYAQEPTVIGFDLMNEPFPGSAAQQSQYLLFQRGAELLSGLGRGPAASAEDLMLQWLDPAGRCQILESLEDPDLFAQVVDVTTPIYTAFEQGPLAELYQRVGAAVRAVNPAAVLFLETSMGSNMGVYSGVRPFVHNGARDPRQAYAPHGYDLVVDTPGNANSSPGRVELIFDRHAETARRWDLPMLVGEWGAYGDAAGTLPAARVVSRLFEKHLCGDTYWAYEPGFPQAPCFAAVCRPYPERTAGILHSYTYDDQADVFSCAWQEDPAVRSPTRIYLPAWFSPAVRSIELDPPGAGWELEIDHSGAAWLIIAPAVEAPPGLRRLRVAGPARLHFGSK